MLTDILCLKKARNIYTHLTRMLQFIFPGEDVIY